MEQNAHRVSICPSDFTGNPEPLNLDDRKLIKSIHELSFDEFVSRYQAPPMTTHDYFDMRYVPDVWDECTEGQSRSHLFLYTHCFMSNRPELRDWMEARVSAKKSCRETGNEAGLIWLNKRPKYALRMISSGDRCSFPAWSEKVRGWFIGSVRPYRLTARLLFISYSSKVLLDSGVDLGRWRPALEREWDSWITWVNGEKQEILRFFSLK